MFQQSNHEVICFAHVVEDMSKANIFMVILLDHFNVCVNSFCSAFSTCPCFQVILTFIYFASLLSQVDCIS